MTHTDLIFIIARILQHCCSLSTRSKPDDEQPGSFIHGAGAMMKNGGTNGQNSIKNLKKVHKI